MLQTPLCTLLGIEFPIIQAGMGVFTSAELAAAVSNAGGLGSVGTFLRPAEDLPQQLARLRASTSRPFAVNHLVPALDEGAFAHTLAARPPVIALALGDATAALPWVTQAPQVFVAASHDRALTAGGAVADGVYINYGLHRENVRDAEAIVRRSAEAAGRHPDAIEMWQIAALDCSADGESSRRALGKILAFLTGYIVGARDPITRGVPPALSDAVKALCAQYSTRPGQADADLVARLGLFEYLARRHAICGTPDECLTQLAAARAAGVQRLMLSVSLAADPVRTVELFGERVLPTVR